MNTKKNVVFIFLILFLLVTVTQAKKIATLKEISKPDIMTLGDNRIFITEGTSIYVYSLEDFRLLKKFGRAGEGPREFKIIPIGFPMMIAPYNEKLFINSLGKLSVFTKEGEFIKEAKVTPHHLYWPFKNKFAAMGPTADDKGGMVLSVKLYNEKFEKEKVLYFSTMTPGVGSPSFKLEFPLDPVIFRVHKDYVYSVVGKEGFVIEVFDVNGKKVNRIEKDYAAVKMTEEYKNATLDYFKTNPNYKQLWNYFKTRIFFRSHFPHIQDMFVKDDMIYIVTFKVQKGKTEFIILDLKGKELKKAYVPFKTLVGMDYHPKCDIYRRAFYALEEDEDKEVWELHKTDIIK
jgi:hypothetical protein